MITNQLMTKLFATSILITLDQFNLLFAPHGHHLWMRFLYVDSDLLRFYQLLDTDNRSKFINYINSQPEAIQ